MEGSALAPPRQAARQVYMILSILLGIAGAMVAMAGFAKGQYRVGPLVVEMAVRPSTSGTTELGVQPIPGAPTIRTGNAVVETHSGFLGLEATVIGVYGVGRDLATPDVLAAVQNPKALADLIQRDGKSAARRFGLRVGYVVLAGGAAGGLAIALLGMKTRRIFQGAAAGVITVAILAILAWQTYDVDEFSKVQFRRGEAQLLQR